MSTKFTAEDWVAAAICNLRNHPDVAEWQLYEALESMDSGKKPSKRFKNRLEELRDKHAVDQP